EAVPRDSSTFARLNTASTLYAQQRPKTAEALWRLLHHHEGGPGALCPHGAADDPASHATAAIAVMELSTGALRIVSGCERRGRATRFERP
ncbi:MAG: hypothetical protein AAF721_41350, partial [Myxococcota bacterium]